MITAIYSAMHFFVDFICAWSMYTYFHAGAYLNFLIYNFCAFALQMPLGTLLDVLCGGTFGRSRGRLSLIWTLLGLFFTGIGAVLHPALLGLGNALFHVGGGIAVIGEDDEKKRGGRNLGLFVAPGAIGLYCGTLLGKKGSGILTLLLPLCALVLLAVFLFPNMGKRSVSGQAEHSYIKKKSLAALVLCCFAVVILRSWTGFEAVFSWKQGEVLPLLAVFAAASGKALGGFAAARFGPGKTMTVSLVLAALLFLLGENPVCGLTALLLFNMSMPVTLYLLAKAMPSAPGFAFGLLTFGLFLGYLPVQAGMDVSLSGGAVGALGSAVSAVLMAAAWKAVSTDAVHK